MFLSSGLLFTASLYVCMCVCAAMGRPVAHVLLDPVPADLSDRVLHVPAGTLAAQAGHGPAVLPVPRAVSFPRCSALNTISAETGARNSTLSLWPPGCGSSGSC